MTKKKDTKSRGWCFTINNYTDDSMAMLMAVYEETDEVTYLVAGFEVAPKTKTEHIQGYIYFKNPVRFKTVSALLPKIHIEAQASSSNVAAWVYCRKDGNSYEMGERPRQGQRTDLEDIRLDLDKGVPLTEIQRTNFNQWVFHRRAFAEYQEAQGLLPKHDTKLIQYDEENPATYNLMYDEYNPNTDLILYHFTHPGELMNLYKTGKYKRLYAPGYTLTEWMKSSFVDYTI